MPMSFGGRVASSSGCAIRPRGEEIGLTGSAAPTRHSSLTGSYAMATAEQREPCDSRGSCTVLGAPGGETPPGDSTSTTVAVRAHVCCKHMRAGIDPNFKELTAVDETGALIGPWNPWAQIPEIWLGRVKA